MFMIYPKYTLSKLNYYFHYGSFHLACNKCGSTKIGKELKMYRILIVDNEEDVCSALKMVLQQNGFKVDYFAEPILALDNFKAGTYDLLLLDIKMPDMDGFQLYQEIKK